VKQSLSVLMPVHDEARALRTLLAEVLECPVDLGQTDIRPFRSRRFGWQLLLAKLLEPAAYGQGLSVVSVTTKP
jgi:hypothetical protein